MNNHVPLGYKQTEVGVITGDWEVMANGEIGVWAISIVGNGGDIRGGADIGGDAGGVGARRAVPLRNMPRPGNRHE